MNNMKKIIGLVPASNNLFKTELVYEDKYSFPNNYIERIKAGGINLNSKFNIEE